MTKDIKSKKLGTNRIKANIYYRLINLIMNDIEEEALELVKKYENHKWRDFEVKFARDYDMEKLALELEKNI